MICRTTTTRELKDDKPKMLISMKGAQQWDKKQIQANWKRSIIYLQFKKIRCSRQDRTKHAIRFKFERRFQCQAEKFLSGQANTQVPGRGLTNTLFCASLSIVLHGGWLLNDWLYHRSIWVRLRCSFPRWSSTHTNEAPTLAIFRPSRCCLSCLP